MRIELAKLILVGTRITYQATGDAGDWLTIMSHPGSGILLSVCGSKEARYSSTGHDSVVGNRKVIAGFLICAWVRSTLTSV